MPATDRAVDLTRIAARAAAEKKAERIIAIDVSERLALTDVFLIISGGNDRRVRAIVDAVEEAMLAAGARRVQREGFQGPLGPRRLCRRRRPRSADRGLRALLVGTAVEGLSAHRAAPGRPDADRCRELIVLAHDAAHFVAARSDR